IRSWSGDSEPPESTRSMTRRRTRFYQCSLRRARSAAVILLLALVANSVRAETTIVVAADGSGEFKSVQEAVMKIPDGRPDNPVVIHIKPGTYKEPIYIQHEKRFFRLIGEDAKSTVLTYDLYADMKDKDGRKIGTFRTPSTYIDADDFTAENLT